MKFPLILRSTHDREMRLEIHVLNELKDDYMDLNNELYKANRENKKLEYSNSELAIKLTIATTRANKYEDWYNNLTYVYRDSQIELNDKTRELQEAIRDLERYKKKVDAFEKLYSEYKEKSKNYKNNIGMMGKVYNNMNRKLWCNEEVKRQLRKLADDLREADKINKNDVAKYLEGLSMIAGGGEKFEFVGFGDDANAKG